MEEIKKIGRKVLHQYPHFWNQCERCKGVVPPAQTFRWDAKIDKPDIDRNGNHHYSHEDHFKWNEKMICLQCVGTLKGGRRNGTPKLYGGY